MTYVIHIMLEILFTAGAVLQIARIHRRDLPQHLRIFTLSGITLLFLLLLGIAPLLSMEIIDGFFTVAMVVATLWAIVLGLFSMRAAPTWSPISLIFFHTMVGYIIWSTGISTPWIVIQGIALVFSLLLLLPWKKVNILHIIAYAFAILMAIVLEVLYVLPIMTIPEPDGIALFVTGSLFFSLGAMGFFGVKYLTMVVSTSIRHEKEWKDKLSTWLLEHLPPSTYKEYLRIVIITAIMLCVGALSSIDTALVLGLALLFTE